MCAVCQCMFTKSAYQIVWEGDEKYLLDTDNGWTMWYIKGERGQLGKSSKSGNQTVSWWILSGFDVATHF